MSVKDEKDKKCILAIVILALVRLTLYLANGSVCGFTFYQPKEPDLHELFERSAFVNKKLSHCANKKVSQL